MSGESKNVSAARKSRRRFYLTKILIVMIAVAMILSGCGKSDDGTDKGSGKDAGKTADADGVNIYVGNTIFDGSLDPVKGAMSYGYAFTNNALIRVNPKSEYEGDVSSEWNISGDALTYTFTLREGVKFSDGADLTAEDVVFTYETVKAKQAENGDADLTKLKSVRAVDGKTVEFTLTEPCSTFLDSTAMLGIVPAASYDSRVFDQTPVGAGPWKIAQYTPNQQIIAVPNEHYYGGAPKISKVTLVSMEADAAIAAAKSGQLDVVMVDPNFAGEQISGMTMQAFETMDIRNISLPVLPSQKVKDKEGKEITVGNDVTADVAVRKALNIGLSRQKIIQNAFNGIGKPAVSFTKNLIWAAPEEVADGKKEEANALLEQAGWVDKDGDGVREKGDLKCAFKVVATETARFQLAAAAAEEAKALGIAIEAINGTWDDVDKESHTNGVVWGWGQYSPTVLTSLFDSSSFLTSSFSNVVGLKNKMVDGFIAAAISAPTQGQAIENWKKVQETANAEVPYLYLVNIEHCYFVSDRLNISKDTQIPHPHGHGSPVICNMADWTIK